MFATTAKPHNYVGKLKGGAETLHLTPEQHDSYISGVLSEGTHKKDLMDFSNPSKKLRTTMDLVATALKANKAKVVRDLLRIHKFDFVVRCKLPPKHNGVSRSRDENIIRDGRRTLNWLYETADEHEIDVSDINEHCSHFDHCVSAFVSGECVFDLRNQDLLRAAYAPCFDDCIFAIKDKRQKDRIALENAVLQCDNEVAQLFTPPAKKAATKYPLPNLPLSPIDALDEAMLVDQDRHHYDPRFMPKAPNAPTPKKLFPSPPQPPATPSKYASNESGFELLLEAAKSVPVTNPKKRKVENVKIREKRVLKQESLVSLGSKLFKMTTETKFEEVEELEV
jgi:hypothetical protein